MAIRQITTKSVKARGIMSSRAFVDGFTDVRKGKPFQYDYSQDLDTQWAYERGRILACTFNGPLKSDRRVTYEAIMALGEALNTGIML